MSRSILAVVLLLAAAAPARAADLVPFAGSPYTVNGTDDSRFPDAVRGDFDADGKPDVLVTQRGGLMLWHSTGTGFTPGPASAIGSTDTFTTLDTGRIDAGDTPDAVVSVYGTGIQVLIGAGNGAFTAAGPFSLSGDYAALVSSPGQIVTGLSALTVRKTFDGAKFVAGGSDATLSATAASPMQVTPDGILASDTHDVLTLYPDGAPSIPVAAGGSSIRQALLADVDGDGDRDAVIITDRGKDSPAALEVALRSGGSFGALSFHPLGTNDLPEGSIAAGNLDGDGKADVVASVADTVYVLSNGTVTSVPSGAPYPNDVAVGDFDGDGRDDVAVASASGLRLDALHSGPLPASTATPTPVPDGPQVNLVGGGKTAPGVSLSFDASLSTGAAITYAWTIDGAPTGDRTPSIKPTFNAPGEHTVSVIVRDTLGRIATASAKATVTEPPSIYLNVPNGRVPYGKPVKMSVKPLTEAGTKIDYTTWSFAGGKTITRSARAGTIPTFTAPKSATLVKGLSLTHKFDKPTKFTVVAHQSDGQTTFIFGKVVSLTKQQKFGLIDAFSARGSDSPYPSVGRGTVLEDVSTDGIKGTVQKCKTLVTGKKICTDVEGYPDGTASQHHLVGFKTGDGQCGGFCKVKEIETNLGGGFFPSSIGARYEKSGTYQVTMRIDRDGEESDVTGPVEVADSFCGGTAVFRGIKLGPGCYPEIHDAATGSTFLLGEREEEFNGVKVRAPGDSLLQMHTDSGLVTAGPGSDDLFVTYGPVNLARTPGFIMPQVSGDGADLPEAIGSASIGTFRDSLKVNGLKVRMIPNAPAQLTFNLQLPDPFGGTATTQLTSPMPTLAESQAARITVPAMSFGPISVGETTLARESNGLLHGGTSLDIFGAGIDAADAPGANPFPTGVGINSTGLKYAGANVTLPVPIPLGPIAKITKIGAGVGLHPFRITGTGTFATNLPPIGGSEVISVDACMAMILASGGDPATAEPLCQAKYTGTNTVVRADGALKFIGIGLGTGFVQYEAGQEVSFGGHLGYTLPVPLVTITLAADLAGRFASLSDWQVTAGASLTQDLFCLPIVGCAGLSGKVGVSDSALAVCGELAGGIGVGGYVKWSGGFGLIGGSCGNKVAEKIARSFPDGLAGLRSADGSRVAAFGAAASDSVTLPAGLPHALLVVEGDGTTTPEVTVNGPSKGTVYTSPALKKAIIAIPRPQAGRYTISATSGTITDIERVDGLPEPKVTGKVVKAGKGLALQYKTTGLAGRTVTFTDGSGRKLGTARGTAGTLRFTPAATAVKAKRQVTALIDQNGVPSETVKVASYAVKPVKLGKVRKLKLTVKRTRGTVTFKRAAGAKRYAVRIQRSDGGVLDLRTAKTSLTFKATGGTKVSVRALDATGRAGKAVTAKKKPPKPKPLRL